ncbi:hypothetical protein V5799_022719 [Amblyomma americanum]|uniref:Uncharacterized protein n=1 Tax=Amblyomma americanum TaxID=6943 RepID=A0AAQ4FJW0_AMBAM
MSTRDAWILCAVVQHTSTPPRTAHYAFPTPRHGSPCAQSCSRQYCSLWHSSYSASSATRGALEVLQDAFDG